jgi:hypothetical protein
MSKVGLSETIMTARFKSTFLSFIIVLGLFFTNFIIQVGVNPGYKSMSTDSGTFAYCGQVIYDGGLMYRDCWDNKPPAVYYLNALAVGLAGANPFAIWLFQAVWAAITLMAFYLVVNHIWQHKGLAALSAFVFLLVFLYPDIFQGGNFTETYTILPITLSFYAFWAFLHTAHQRWLIILGALNAIGFLLKPTYISMGMAAAVVLIYLYLRSHSGKKLWVNLAVLGLSALVPLVLVGLYWVWMRDFSDLWFAVFTHNISYVESGFSLHSLYGTVRIFLLQQPMAALTILAGMSWVVFLVQNAPQIFSRHLLTERDVLNLFPGRMNVASEHVWFMAAIFLSIFFDIAFLASSGKNFGHYLQVVVPSMVVALLALLSVIRQGVRQHLPDPSLLMLSISSIILILLSASLEVISKEKPDLQELRAFFSNPNPSLFQPTELEQYISDHSAPTDAVLIWAGHPSMNFVTHRRSPTRFIFLQHLFTPVPGAVNGFGEFMQELQADPPQLIVVQPISSAGLPYFGNPVNSICPGCDPPSMDGMLALKQFVDARYELNYSIWDWVVYTRLP